MRIAFVSLMGGHRWGGSEALWQAVADYALQQNDAVFVSVYDWGSLPDKIKSLQAKGALVNTRKHYNAHAGLVERIGRFVKKRKPSLDKEYQTILDFRPDAVFISQGDSFDLAIHHYPFYWLLRKNAVPYSFVCHSHLQYSFLPPKEIYPGAVEVFQNANRVYFISHRQWQLTERRLATKLENAGITWNPLNLAIPPSPLNWPAEEIINFAMVANLDGSKGHDTAFEVLSAPEWRNRPWQLNIYGTGDGMAYLQALASFFQIENKVRFKGFTTDILNVWETNHLLLVPSAGEGMPISLVEAMACGRPAVATDVGGNAELIRDGENGIIAASPTTEQFALALECAWDKRGFWKQMGQAAFNLVRDTVEKKPHVKLYNDIQQMFLESTPQKS